MAVRAVVVFLSFSFFTSAGVKVWEAVKNDAMEEERRGVDLHRPAQEAVEDPHVPAGGERIGKIK